MTEPAIEAMAAVLYADKASPWVPKWDEISDGAQRYWIERVQSVLTPLLDGGYVVLTDPAENLAGQALRAKFIDPVASSESPKEPRP